MEMLQSGSGARSALDPRTKILLLFAVSSVLLLGGSSPTMYVLRTIMLLAPFVLVAASGHARAAVLMLVVYLASYALAIFVSPITEGVVNSIIVATCTVVSRFVPTMAMAYYVFATTTVSEFMASMERMHMPNWITIPLSVLFRFFPTLAQEAQSIHAAMRMRGITPMKSGLAYVEYCLVPLMVSAVSIGEDLSAAALTRGLGAPVKRTNLCEIGFRVRDVLICVLALAALIVLAVALFVPEANL